MLRTTLDHIVITAPSLVAGVEYVRQRLGASPLAGGEHACLGTHNALLKLGEKLYLEVIAINPNAPAPERSRWFQLDKPDATSPILLATWIVRTDDIHAAAVVAPEDMVEVEPMSRGALNWLITVPANGSLPLHGIAPTLIQRITQEHPAARLLESGCSLMRLGGFHPEARKVKRVLETIGFAGDFYVSGLP